MQTSSSASVLSFLASLSHSRNLGRHLGIVASGFTVCPRGSWLDLRLISVGHFPAPWEHLGRDGLIPGVSGKVASSPRALLERRCVYLALVGGKVCCSLAPGIEDE
jgi:hypothetical protein